MDHLICAACGGRIERDPPEGYDFDPPSASWWSRDGKLWLRHFCRQHEGTFLPTPVRGFKSWVDSVLGDKTPEEIARELGLTAGDLDRIAERLPEGIAGAIVTDLNGKGIAVMKDPPRPIRETPKGPKCGKLGPLGIKCEAPAGHDEGPHPLSCWGTASTGVTNIGDYILPPTGVDPDKLRAFATRRRPDDPRWLDYPAGWPQCAAGCGRPALDGHATCGDAACNEASYR